MNSYDTFARFYDATMGDRGDVIDLLKTEIAATAPDATTLLELGCGTGSILAGFNNAYELTGIDKSSQMLQIAQHKLPDAHFIEGDITTFELNKKFDLIICVFDTINHLSDIMAWQKTFQSVRHHLAPRGVFIFDMNTVGRMQKLAAMPTYTQTVDSLTVDMEIELAGPDTVDWHITIQDPQTDGTIQVYEDSARERSYALSDVLTLLNETSFDVIKSFDSQHHPATDESDRAYFVCRVK